MLGPLKARFVAKILELRDSLENHYLQLSLTVGKPGRRFGFSHRGYTGKETYQICDVKPESKKETWLQVSQRLMEADSYAAKYRKWPGQKYHSRYRSSVSNNNNNKLR